MYYEPQKRTKYLNEGNAGSLLEILKYLKMFNF